MSDFSTGDNSALPVALVARRDIHHAMPIYGDAEYRVPLPILLMAFLHHFDGAPTINRIVNLLRDH